MKKTTLKDIAEVAGVSIATVSMILSGKGSISEAVVTRVQNIALELGYEKYPKARAAIRNDFKYVAIIQQEVVSYLWNFSIPFGLYLEDVVQQNAKNPIVLHAPVQQAPEVLYREIMGAKVGAVFSLHYVERNLFTKLESAGVPVIIVNNSEYQNEFSSVISDNFQSSYEAALNVVDLGHRLVGYAEYKRPDYSALIADRYYGYRRGLEQSGIDFDDRFYISVEIENYISLLNRIREIYSLADAPSAWVVHDDFFAACLIEALKTIGKSVPEDISVIAAGGDVLDYSLPFIPNITTMQGDRKLMASMAWSLLESRLRSESKTVQVLKTKMPLVDRGSCRRFSESPIPT
jgi:LacI family transcriptional regulator